MEWMLMPLRRYADFNGRSRRKEYWMYALGYFIVATILGVIGNILGGGATSGFSMAHLLILVLALALIVPSLAVMVRRFHDQDKSGWWVLLSFIPFGGLVVLVFMCIEGTRGENQYGPDPKAGFVG